MCICYFSNWKPLISSCQLIVNDSWQIFMCQFEMLIWNEQNTYICMVLIYAIRLISQQLRSAPPMIYIFVFYRVTSIWENSLQITTISSFVGIWLGAFPIPLDWGRPWQVGFNSLKQQSKCLYSEGKTDDANECIYKLFHSSVK